MEDRILGINLIIDGISYPLTIKASEEPYYRQAARLVNKKASSDCQASCCNRLSFCYFIVKTVLKNPKYSR